MSITTTARTLLASLAFCFASNAVAQSQNFNINPGLSTVAFTLTSNDDTTKGTFRVEKGVVAFNPASTQISGMVIVSAASGNSGNSTRDKRMLKEVLQASRFANITFAPQSYTGSLALTGDSHLQVTGIFSLHGTSHTITVPMLIHIQGNQCTASTTFKVPYVQWGLKDPSWFIFRVAKEVTVNLTLTGLISPVS
ncbi:MAG: YceI family protein [Acidobacteriaceae bacterium]